MERKLTNRDIAEAYFMRLNGEPLSKIAETFGVSTQRMQQILPRVKTRKKLSEKFVYPNICHYMLENEFSIKKFSDLCGVCNASMSQILCGSNVSKKTIDKILEVTGMTYEMAFYREK